jgi:hypothetical protein
VLDQIDSLLRRPGIALVAPATLGLAVLVPGGLAIAQRAPDERVPALVALGLTGLALALGAWWGIWTWRRLWRVGDSPAGHMIYGLGVRRCGVLVWSGIPVLGLANLLRDRDLTLWEVLVLLGMGWVICLPLGLWVGYWWGRSLAAFWGLSDE